MRSEWSRPEIPPPLGPGEAQVWRIALDDPDRCGLLDTAYAVLTGDERERAARMRAGAVREEFIVARGYLRRLLARLLGGAANGIALEVGPHGKPRLAEERGIWFNVAHSRGMILIAISRTGAVGVDVEWVDRSVEALEIARSAFHPADVARIEGATSERERVAEFYRCWTRKEAVAKADGRGLTLDVAGFATGAEDGGERVVEVPGQSGAGAARYFVRGVDVGEGYDGALATSGSGIAVTLLDLSHDFEG